MSLELLPLPIGSRLPPNTVGTVPDNFDPTVAGGGSQEYDIVLSEFSLYSTVEQAVAEGYKRIYIAGPITETNRFNITTNISITIQEDITWTCMGFTAVENQVVIKSSSKRHAFIEVNLTGHDFPACIEAFRLNLHNIAATFNYNNSLNETVNILEISSFSQQRSILENTLIYTTSQFTPRVQLYNCDLQNTKLYFANALESVDLYGCQINNFICKMENIIDPYNNVQMYDCSGSLFEIDNYNSYNNELNQISTVEVRLIGCAISILQALDGYPYIKMRYSTINTLYTRNDDTDSNVFISAYRSSISSLACYNVFLKGCNDFTIGSGVCNNLAFYRNFDEDYNDNNSDIYIGDMYVNSDVRITYSASRLYFSNCRLDDDIQIEYPDTEYEPSWDSTVPIDNRDTIYIYDMHINNCQVDNIRITDEYFANLNEWYATKCDFENIYITGSDINGFENNGIYTTNYNNSMYNLHISNTQIDSVFSVRRIQGARFTNCDFDTNIYISEYLDNVHFTNCRLQNIELGYYEEPPEWADIIKFTECSFSNCLFNGDFYANYPLEQFNFINCDLKYAIDVLQLKYCNFTACRMSIIYLNGEITGNYHLIPDFEDDQEFQQYRETADMYKTNFTDCSVGFYESFGEHRIGRLDLVKFTNCDFSRYAVIAQHMYECSLTNCNFNNQIFEPIRFIQCNMVNCQLARLQTLKNQTYINSLDPVEDQEEIDLLVNLYVVEQCTVQNCMFSYDETCIDVGYTHESKFIDLKLQNEEYAVFYKLDGCKITRWFDSSGLNIVRNCDYNNFDTFDSHEFISDSFYYNILVNSKIRNTFSSHLIAFNRFNNSEFNDVNVALDIVRYANSVWDNGFIENTLSNCLIDWAIDVPFITGCKFYNIIINGPGIRFNGPPSETTVMLNDMEFYNCAMSINYINTTGGNDYGTGNNMIAVGCHFNELITALLNNCRFKSCEFNTLNSDISQSMFKSCNFIIITNKAKNKALYLACHFINSLPVNGSDVNVLTIGCSNITGGNYTTYTYV